MSNAVYTFMEHTDGWAYLIDGASSQVFPSLDQAREAARLVEIEKSDAGDNNKIIFEDAFGRWYEPLFEAIDPPSTPLSA